MLVLDKCMLKCLAAPSSDESAITVYLKVLIIALIVRIIIY